MSKKVLFGKRHFITNL